MDKLLRAFLVFLAGVLVFHTHPPEESAPFSARAIPVANQTPPSADDHHSAETGHAAIRKAGSRSARAILLPGTSLTMVGESFVIGPTPPRSDVSSVDCDWPSGQGPPRA